MGAPHRLTLAAVSLLFFFAHVRALPRTLEDIDSINLALGVESFDVASHRPHPPGYPVFIALSKMSTAAIGVVAPSWDRDRRAASGLAVWSLIAGSLAVFVIAQLLTAAGFTPWLATLSAIVCVASPLFWFSAVRPLTDVPGLVAALLVQVWLVRGLKDLRAGTSDLPRELIWAAAAAGFIIGLRSQTIWLTAPLLVWCARSPDCPSTSSRRCHPRGGSTCGCAGLGGAARHRQRRRGVVLAIGSLSGKSGPHRNRAARHDADGPPAEGRVAENVPRAVASHRVGQRDPPLRHHRRRAAGPAGADDRLDFDPAVRAVPAVPSRVPRNRDAAVRVTRSSCS